MRTQSPSFKAGSTAPVPECGLFRVVPVGLLAAYPRQAKVGTAVVTLYSPDQWFKWSERTPNLVVSKSDFGAAVQAASDMPAAQGDDPADELWCIEAVGDCAEAQSGAVLPTSRRLLWQSLARDWNANGKGAATPVLDVGAFEDIFIQLACIGAQPPAIFMYAPAADGQSGATIPQIFTDTIANGAPRQWFIGGPAWTNLLVSQKQLPPNLGGLLWFKNTTVTTDRSLSLSVYGRPR